MQEVQPNIEVGSALHLDMLQALGLMTVADIRTAYPMSIECRWGPVLMTRTCCFAVQEVSEHFGAPPVKPGQVEAIAFVQEVAADPKLRFDIKLQPGQTLAKPAQIPLDNLLAVTQRCMCAAGMQKCLPPYVQATSCSTTT